jgi:hypothetical protein
MIRRNPLLVAKEHGHRLTTMLSVCAAWTDGAVDADVTAIRDGMNRTNHGEHHAVRQPGYPAAMPPWTQRQAVSALRVGGDPVADEMRFGSRFASGGESPLHKHWKNFGGKGGTRTRRRDEPDQ